MSRDEENLDDTLANDGDGVRFQLINGSVVTGNVIAFNAAAGVSISNPASPL